MRVINDTLQEISKLTTTIEADYPELYDYLNENPITMPANGSDNRFESYLSILKELLRQHLEAHKAKKRRLEDMARQISYSQEGIQSKIIFEREKQKTILFAFSEGQQLKEHTTAYDVILIMLEGEGEFTLGESVQHLKAGQVYRIPANEPHALKAVTNFKMVLIR